MRGCEPESAPRRRLEAFCLVLFGVVVLKTNLPRNSGPIFGRHLSQAELGDHKRKGWGRGVGVGVRGGAGGNLKTKRRREAAREPAAARKIKRLSDASPLPPLPPQNKSVAQKSPLCIARARLILFMHFCKELWDAAPLSGCPPPLLPSQPRV